MRNIVYLLNLFIPAVEYLYKWNLTIIWYSFAISLVEDPEYVAVHENSRTSTPKGLTQVQYQRYHSFVLEIELLTVFSCFPNIVIISPYISRLSDITVEKLNLFKLPFPSELCSLWATWEAGFSSFLYP